MHLHVIPTPFFGANALVLVADGETAALVVDPSAGVRERIREVLDSHGAHVGGVLLTHGHADHVWDAAEIASWAPGLDEAPVWIPQPDMYRLDDPLAQIPFRPEGLDLGQWRRPTDVRAFPSGTAELVPGVWMLMVPAPGHSEGSALFLGNCDIEITVHSASSSQGVALSDTPVPWALSGDVIFAGSVGRTDLPGGDEVQMRHSLRTVSNAVDPATILVPGHGPLTTLADEIATNPYLARARQIG